MGLLALTLVWLTTAAAECPNPEFIVNEVEENVQNFFLADAQDAMKRAEAAYACSEVARPEPLARLWLAEGVLYFLNGDAEASELPFAAASRVAPEVWVAGYGDEPRAIYDKAAAAEVALGQLRLQPAPRGLWVAIDGAEQEHPFELASGFHLVQAGKKGEPNAQFARVVRVVPDEELVVQTGLRGGVPEGPLLASAPVRHTSRNLAIVGGVTGLASVVSLSIAASRKSSFDPTAEGGYSDYAVNRISGYSGYGLFGVTGVLVGVAVLKGQW